MALRQRVYGRARRYAKSKVQERKQADTCFLVLHSRVHVKKTSETIESNGTRKRESLTETGTRGRDRMLGAGPHLQRAPHLQKGSASPSRELLRRCLRALKGNLKAHFVTDMALEYSRNGRRMGASGRESAADARVIQGQREIAVMPTSGHHERTPDGK